MLLLGQLPGSSPLLGFLHKGHFCPCLPCGSVFPQLVLSSCMPNPPSYPIVACGLFRVASFCFCLLFSFSLLLTYEERCALAAANAQILGSGHPENSIQTTDRTRLGWSPRLRTKVVKGGLGMVARPKVQPSIEGLSSHPPFDLTTLVY